MATSTWTESDSAKAREIWAEYQRDRDLSHLKGKTAGIDPKSGRVWIGDSMEDVVEQRDADGCSPLLLFERIGYPTYYRKPSRRRPFAKS